MVEALRLHEGAQVEVLPVTETADETQPQIRYASADEVMKIHRKLEPNHAEAYRELAK